MKECEGPITAHDNQWKWATAAICLTLLHGEPQELVACLKVTVGGLRRLNKQVETPGVGRRLKVAVGGLPRLTEQKSFTMCKRIQSHL